MVHYGSRVGSIPLGTRKQTKIKTEDNYLLHYLWNYVKIHRFTDLESEVELNPAEMKLPLTSIPAASFKKTDGFTIIRIKERGYCQKSELIVSP